MTRDIHSKAFDKGTKTKLHLYRQYVEAWLPVFMTNRSEYAKKGINIYDLFCGPGHDATGECGSPLILLDTLNVYKSNPQTCHHSPVKIFFNDGAKYKVEKLEQCICQKYGDLENVHINYSARKFEDIFPEMLGNLKNRDQANLVFLDQNGINALDKNNFLQLIESHKTDWILFVASNFVYRFRDHPSIKQYIDIASCECNNKYQIHNVVANWYKDLIPDGMEYYISQFTILKNNNIYGLIFGTANPRGAAKFLTACWNIDPVYGTANYDIPTRGKAVQQQLTLFPSSPRLQHFKDSLREELQSGNLTTNKDVYLFALNNGFLPKHASENLKAFKSEGLIERGQISLSYKKIFKENAVEKIRLKA
ncbi:three-Cys-motif partner protein TcmP [Nitratidesulfovibrio vulgaris]|uniref:three-Cys-motif partner protein TcmP n=1 Tax=Nitratidesulfovibrio vulgaris TaxID=881 RepID=UPI002300BC11|nr:three-Cys-motif partner protein TcmP [Nitratidesulfovibrio vulgaris]WCB45252.1 three-Cys-motif partner protein TcmP [Nitratidesulfovibrio vulgaris]